MKALRVQDNYLNPNLRTFPKQNKRNIKYVDIMSDNEKSIQHTESKTSPGEYEICTHFSYLSKPGSFSDESGDEKHYDKDGNFLVPKIETVSDENSENSGVESVKESEEETTKNLRHKSVPTNTGQLADWMVEDDNVTINNNELPRTAPTPSTSSGIIRVEERTEMETRSLQMLIAKEGKNDDNRLQDPETALRQNLAQIFENPEILYATILKDGIAKRQKVVTQDGTELDDNFGANIDIPEHLKNAPEEEEKEKEGDESRRDKGKGKGKKSKQKRKPSKTQDAQETPGQENAPDDEVQNLVPETDAQGKHETEICDDTHQHPRQPLILNFVPLNPENGGLPPTSTPSPQENNNQPQSLSPTDCQLHLHGITAEFPFTEDSLEGARTNNSIHKLHLELSGSGYDLKEGDIVRCTPLGDQARDSSKIPIVTTNKDQQTKQAVARAARKARLWNSRAPKEGDKEEGREGFFKEVISRRTGKQKREEQKPVQAVRVQPRSSPKPKLAKNPFFNKKKPHEEDEGTEDRKRSEASSTTPSVEIINEVKPKPIPQEIIDEIQLALYARDRIQDSPKTHSEKLTRGLVPHYTVDNTPEASGEEPASNSELLEDGELPPQNNSPTEHGESTPPNNSPLRQEAATSDDGEHSTSDDDTNVTHETPSRARTSAVKPPRQQLYPRYFPRVIERDPNKPLTPPSPIYRDGEPDQITQSKNATGAVPSTEPSPQDQEDEDLEMIRHTQTPIERTRITYNLSPTKTQNRPSPNRPHV